MGFMFGGGNKSNAPAPVAPPSVTPAAGTSGGERIRKVGRAALVASSPQGVLGNARTGRNKLLAA